MNRIFERFSHKERKALVRLTAACLIALAVGLSVFMRFKGGYFDAKDSLAKLENDHVKVVRALEEAESEWLRWQEALADLEMLGTEYFYSAEEEITSLRLDLQRLFALAGVTVSDIGYGYSDLDKEQARKTVVTFSYRGSYAGFKRLLGIIEGFPRFLVIERLDFQRTGSDGGPLICKLTLAGYYGS